MDGDGYIVTILRRGEHSHYESGCSRRKSSTVLLRGPSGCIVVNPGSVWDGPELISSLKAAGVSNPEKDITCVICTDGRAENVGCMSLFQNADMMIVGYDIQKRGDIFLEHDFSDGVVPYEFDEHVSLECSSLEPMIFRLASFHCMVVVLAMIYFCEVQ